MADGFKEARLANRKCACRIADVAKLFLTFGVQYVTVVVLDGVLPYWSVSDEKGRCDG
jgi:hypothetical protein